MPTSATRPKSAPLLIGRAQPRIFIADVGATWTRVGVGQEQIDSDRTEKFRTPQDYDALIYALGNKASALFDGKRPDAVGFGIAGQVQGGVITMAGKLTEYGFVGKPITVDVSDITGIDPTHVAGDNDVRTAGKAEQMAQLRKHDGDMGVQTIHVVSTGLAGAILTAEGVLADETGHQYLRSGAICGCGLDGCFEAHASGSGIERKFGVRGENIAHSDPRWGEVVTDLVTGFDNTLKRYEQDFGIEPHRMSFYGAVALGGPNLLAELQSGLDQLRGDNAPTVDVATYGDESGMYGAYFAARETL